MGDDSKKIFIKDTDYEQLKVDKEPFSKKKEKRSLKQKTQQPIANQDAKSEQCVREAADSIDELVEEAF